MKIKEILTKRHFFIIKFVIILLGDNMKRAKLKKKKRIKFIKLKYVFIFFVFFVSFSLTIEYLYNKKIDINNKEYLSYFIDKSYKNKNGYSFIVSSILKIFSNIDIHSPQTFLTFYKSKSNSVTNNIAIKEEYKKEDDYDASNYEKITSYITDNNKVNDPVLYIYNTHQLETYSSEGLTNNMVPNVMMAGSLLSEKLNKKGIKTIFEDTNLNEFISKMGLPSNELYGGSRVFITNAKEKYNTLNYYIDLHRDSVDKDISTIVIDNKKYARILFVLGTTNKNYLENKKMMDKLNEIINNKYPKLSRGIYEVDIPDWGEIYNQDLDKNAILIELGAKDNTMNEVINTIEVLSEAISEYIKGNNL